jgi:hypothetical protein
VASKSWSAWINSTAGGFRSERMNSKSFKG